MRGALLHIFVSMFLSASALAEGHDTSALFAGGIDAGGNIASSARAGAPTPWGVPYLVQEAGTGKHFACNSTLVGRKDIGSTCQLVLLSAGHCVDRQLDKIIFDGRILKEEVPKSSFRVLLPSEFLRSLPGSRKDVISNQDDGALIMMTLPMTSQACGFLTAEKIASLSPSPAGTTNGVANDVGSSVSFRKRNARTTSGTLAKDSAAGEFVKKVHQWVVLDKEFQVSEPGDSGGPFFDADGNLLAPLSGGSAKAGTSTFDPDIVLLADRALTAMDIPHVVRRQWKNLPQETAAKRPTVSQPAQPPSVASSEEGRKFYLVGKTTDNGDKVLVLEDQDGEARDISIDRKTGKLYWMKEGRLEQVPEPWQTKVSQYYKHADISKLKKKQRELVQAFLNPPTPSAPTPTVTQPSSPAITPPTENPSSFVNLFSGYMDAQGNVMSGLSSPFRPGGGGHAAGGFGSGGRRTPLFAGVTPGAGFGGFGGQTFGSGAASGPLQPGSQITTPPPFNGGSGARVSPSEWEHMRRQHNAMHAKPGNPPAVASGTPNGETPSANALSAIQKCMRCHAQGSDRKLQLAADPASALFGLRDVLEQRNRGVSLFKIMEMMSSDKFGNLSDKEKKGLIAFLTRQSEAQDLAAIQSSAVQKYIGPPDTSLARFLPPQREQAYRNLLIGTARTDNAFLNAIFTDPSTQFYDRAGMPKVYQDGGDNEVAGLHFETSSILQDWDLPGGKKMFPGGSLRGPLGDGFGLPPGTQNFKFIWRPKVNGQTLPVKVTSMGYSIRPGQRTRGTLYDWEYPVGTIVGEVVVENGVAKDIRLREIGPNKTTMATSFRAFPTAEKMKERIQAIPNWESNPELAGMVNHLNNPNRLVAGRGIKDDYYTRLVDIPGGYTDVLPSLSKGTAEQLIANTTFSSALHQEWAREGEKVSFMPTTNGNNITPAGMFAHSVRVDSKSCMQCHEHSMTNFAFLYPQAHNRFTGGNNPQDYGMTYGNSQNLLSPHIFGINNRSFGSGGFFTGNFAVGGSVSDNRRNADGSLRLRSRDTVQSVNPAIAGFYSR